MKIPLILIVGPTAVGKSDLAVRIARKIGGEVISADSRQVYRGLNIGTGKITRKEMKSVRHHLLDVADPHIPAASPRRYSVETWRIGAEKTIAEIHGRGHVPVICGGTGFYIEALVDGISYPDVPPNAALRKKLAKMPPDGLFKMLRKLDPRRANEMLGGKGGGENNRKNRAPNGDSRNPRRLIRAIEIATALGRIPTIKRIPKKDSPYVPLFIGLTLPPEKLKKEIAARLKRRLKQGMIAEARNLHRKGLSWKRMRELGLEYRYIAEYLQGPLTSDSRRELTEKLTIEIRHYAKRQLAWFRRDKRIRWFDAGQKIDPFSLRKTGDVTGNSRTIMSQQVFL